MREPLLPVTKRPVVLIGLAVACSLLGDMTIYAIVPVYHEALGLGPIQVGLLLSANRWIRMFTNQVARRVLDRYRAQHVFAVVLIAGAVTTLIYSSVPPFWLFLIARVLWGVCWSFIRHVGVMTTISAGPHRHAAGVLGVYTGIVQAGFIVGTVAGATLFDRYGFSTAFLVVGLVSLVGVIFDYAGFSRLPAPGHQVPAPAAAGPHRDQPMLLRSFIVSCVSTGLIISTLGFVLRARFGAVIEVGSVVIGITTVNGVLIALHYAINSVGAPVIGIAIDRIGRRLSEIIAFLVGFLALLTAVVFVASPILVPAVVLFFVATVACNLALVSQGGVAGSGRFARLMTASDLGAASGPLIGWVAIDRVGSPNAVFAIGCAMFAVATVSALIDLRAGTGSRRFR